MSSASASPQWDVKSIPLSRKLAFLREQQQCATPRQPGLTLLYASDVLSSHRGSLSDIDRYAIVEQALLAALDCGNEHRAKDLLKQLVHAFSHKSIRVRKLQGMILEAEGQYDAATRAYLEILKDSPLESFVAKRLSAIARAQGNIGEAIRNLDSRPLYVDPKGAADAPKFTFVQMFPTDLMAMRELTSLYWECGQTAQALSYAHECVLLDPFNAATYTRVGELAYAAGKLDDSAVAFAQSARLNDTGRNIRAYYGLWTVALEIARQHKRSSSAEASDQMTRAKQLGTFAATKLKTAYSKEKVTATYVDLMLQKYNSPLLAPQ